MSRSLAALVLVTALVSGLSPAVGTDLDSGFDHPLIRDASPTDGGCCRRARSEEIFVSSWVQGKV